MVLKLPDAPVQIISMDCAYGTCDGASSYVNSTYYSHRFDDYASDPPSPTSAPPQTNSAAHGSQNASSVPMVMPFVLVSTTPLLESSAPLASTFLMPSKVTMLIRWALDSATSRPRWCPRCTWKPTPSPAPSLIHSSASAPLEAASPMSQLQPVHFQGRLLPRRRQQCLFQFQQQPTRTQGRRQRLHLRLHSQRATRFSSQRLNK